MSQKPVEAGKWIYSAFKDLFGLNLVYMNSWNIIMLTVNIVNATLCETD